MENLFCGILLDSYGNGCVDFFEKSFEKNFRKKVAKNFGHITEKIYICDIEIKQNV